MTAGKGQRGREPRVTLRQLSEQVAALTEQIKQLAQRQLYADTFYEIGWQEGRAALQRDFPGLDAAPRLAEVSYLRAISAVQQ